MEDNKLFGEGKIGEYINIVKSAQDAWENAKKQRVRSETNVIAARAAVEAEKNEFFKDELEMSRATNLIRRAEALRNKMLFSNVLCREIVDCLSPLFKAPTKSTTDVLYDPDKDGDNYPWHKFAGSKVTSGKFGLGIRTNVNSRSIFDFDSIDRYYVMQYIISRADIIAPRLAAIKDIRGDILLELQKYMPELPFLNENKICIPINKEFSVVDTWNSFCTYSAISWSKRPFIEVIVPNKRSIYIHPFELSGYIAYKQLYYEFDRIFDELERIANQISRYVKTDGITNITNKSIALLSSPVKKFLEEKADRWRFMNAL